MNTQKCVFACVSVFKYVRVGGLLFPDAKKGWRKLLHLDCSLQPAHQWNTHVYIHWHIQTKYFFSLEIMAVEMIRSSHPKISRTMNRLAAKQLQYVEVTWGISFCQAVALCYSKSRWAEVKGSKGMSKIGHAGIFHMWSPLILFNDIFWTKQKIAIFFLNKVQPHFLSRLRYIHYDHSRASSIHFVLVLLHSCPLHSAAYPLPGLHQFYVNWWSFWWIALHFPPFRWPCCQNACDKMEINYKQNLCVLMQCF